MKNNFVKIGLYFLGCVAVQSVATTSYAGQTIYQLKDSNGTTLLTNKKNRYNHLKVEKKTYYPDSNIHSYSNWGSSEASVLPSYSRNKNAFDSIIKQAASQHGISEGLIKAVMHTESGFNVNARSPVGAQGLMQLMPATAKRFNVSNAFDPYQNIMGGAKYLSWLMKRFNGNTSLVLASYNAGEGNVAKYGGIPPFRETQDYVRRVSSRFSNLYSNGLGHSSSSAKSSSDAGKIVAQSDNYESASAHAAPRYSSQRQIIMASDGSFTDAPGSYATAHATASAKISIADN
ncbi:lytic transglycosylase domain-containing protein [Acinetobacter sp. C_4_1]|uniref:lytic transglycosylase domain-containing protein n=1 Tax=unclassified Acinetobacter TaxID=196816 RepID=UPI0021B7852A|nr:MULTISPECIES: lytic transglycosylase domain-containing protein [unclassified Acinetobacter]MCT8090422.1 lytic transglycosylase domain-containing protein [Acinetobacter sp. F_3_1]MCT8098827.1 lytic transglycosylase domain-containing protein [Acinetobacter sp. C_3_1]MCT8102105.1 lytic transglycosylase domain-containing protein [Acinetobacter sp. C_4_1]MCT8135795.1 lytic transglycosylase domain-containing protein [Acinetobacter sp. T_3_1]